MHSFCGPRLSNYDAWSLRKNEDPVRIIVPSDDPEQGISPADYAAKKITTARRASQNPLVRTNHPRCTKLSDRRLSIRVLSVSARSVLSLSLPGIAPNHPRCTKLSNRRLSLRDLRVSVRSVLSPSLPGIAPNRPPQARAIRACNSCTMNTCTKTGEGMGPSCREQFHRFREEANSSQRPAVNTMSFAAFAQSCFSRPQSRAFARS